MTVEGITDATRDHGRSCRPKKRAPRFRGALPSAEAVSLAAAQIAAAAVPVDLAPDGAPGERTEDGPHSARTAVVDRMADQGAGAGADDQTGRAVVAAAIITSVAALVDPVVIAQPPLAIIAPVPVIIVGIIAAFRSPVIVVA